VGPWDEFQLMATADLRSRTRVRGMREIGCLQIRGMDGKDKWSY
jgi:hypothetical protein